MKRTTSFAVASACPAAALWLGRAHGRGTFKVAHSKGTGTPTR